MLTENLHTLSADTAGSTSADMYNSLYKRTPSRDVMLRLYNVVLCDGYCCTFSLDMLIFIKILSRWKCYENVILNLD